jgi:hypothetical protein
MTTKISTLPTLSTVTDTTIIPVVDSGSTKKITGSILKTYALGAQGATGTSITNRGAWSGATLYVSTDMVTYNGVLYISLAGANLNNNPAATVGTAWQSTQGAQGTTGNTGTQGSTGAQGTTGNTGTQGSTGAQGTTGNTGTQGTTGSTGSTGAQGTTGTTGNTGAQGATGTAGTNGTNGTNGSQGATGATGSTGGTGSTGAQGTTGSTGAQGTSGSGNPRVSSTTSIGSPLAWNSGSYDQYAATAQAGALTINADAGTPSDGQKMIFRFKDNGTAQSLTWTTGSSKAFRAVGITLPTATVVSKTLYVGCVYNSADSRWDAIATAQET